MAAAFQTACLAVLASACELLVGMGLFALCERTPWWRRRALTADVAFWLLHPLPVAVGMAAAVVLVDGRGLAVLSSVPTWAQLGVAFVLTDLLAYGIHRAYHAVPLLWRFHAVHHSSDELHWLSTSRLHPVSQGINTAVVAAALLALGIPPGIVVAANGILGVCEVLGHADVDVDLGRVGRVLGAVLVSPRFHRAHHGVGRGARNLGGALAIWDRLFGTLDDSPPPVTLGLADDEPSSMAALLLRPFDLR